MCVYLKGEIIIQLEWLCFSQWNGVCLHVWALSLCAVLNSWPYAFYSYEGRAPLSVTWALILTIFLRGCIDETSACEVRLLWPSSLEHACALMEIFVRDKDYFFPSFLDIETSKKCHREERVKPEVISSTTQCLPYPQYSRMELGKNEITYNDISSLTNMSATSSELEASCNSGYEMSSGYSSSGSQENSRELLRLVHEQFLKLVGTRIFGSLSTLYFLVILYQK